MSRKMWLAFRLRALWDPDGRARKCEGAALWGTVLGALHEGTRIENGNVITWNSGLYAAAFWADVPMLEDPPLLVSTEVPVWSGRAWIRP